MNASLQLLEAGQSVWYDNIERKLLNNGELARMISQGEIRGVTSNPTIFMNAITKSTDYEESLLALASGRLSDEQLFFALAIEDIQAAADRFRPLYDQSAGGDGFVSLEVSPYLANDTAATLAQAQQLWQQVARPNLMVKIPATKAGVPAIEQAIAAGVNINVTLIFSLQRYGEVMEAYLRGLEQRLEQGLPLERVASVASFFVSRVDSHIDLRLQRIVEAGGPQAALAAGLGGKAAIANAKLAYADYQRVFSSGRFASLKARGARVQRPLWASTSTKNPAYRDVLYCEELIGPDTVNTMPPQTLAAFLDHGVVRPTSLLENLAGARAALSAVEELGIPIEQVAETLEREGVASFADSFTALLQALARQRQAIQAG